MDTITITKEQFREAVMAANEKFRNVGRQPGDAKEEMTHMMMGLQNVLFGSLIADVLFGDNKEEN